MRAFAYMCEWHVRIYTSAYMLLIVRDDDFGWQVSGQECRCTLLGCDSN